MSTNIYTFLLPDIGEGVVEGEVIEWLKQVGEQVKQDEPVVTIMTDKATVELPAPYPGKIHKHYYQPGQMAIKDKPLYDIELQEEIKKQKVEMQPDTKTSQQSTQSPLSARACSESKIVPLPIESSKYTGNKIKAIPKIRHEAKKWDIDLSQISGTGQEGRITEEDLHRAWHGSQTSTSSPERLQGEEEQPLVGIRGRMAQKMHENDIPQFSYFEQTEATRLIQLRHKLKNLALQEEIKLSFMPFFIRALSLTMKQFPQLNASIDMNKKSVILHRQHQIGIAMASPQGLIVPVLKEVEAMGLKEVVKGYEEIKTKASKHKLTATDMKGATITISNFGALPGEGLWATPMIMNPEVAILAVAKMRKVPIVKGDQVVIREMIPLSWSFDHRLIDGDLAAQISHFYACLLSNPASLL